MYNASIPVDASVDLSGQEYKACQITGDVAGTLALAVGILQNKPESGEDASLVFTGRTKMQSGGAITAGALLTVAASGFIVATTSGGYAFGFAETACASGGVFHGVVTHMGNGGA